MHFKDSLGFYFAVFEILYKIGIYFLCLEAAGLCQGSAGSSRSKKTSLTSSILH